MGWGGVEWGGVGWEGGLQRGREITIALYGSTEVAQTHVLHCVLGRDFYSFRDVAAMSKAVLDVKRQERQPRKM